MELIDKPVLMLGNCLDRLKELEDNSIDAICTDPPYGFGNGKTAGFMGKKWDYDVPSVAIWQECLRVLKPGGSLLAFAGTRTQHRMAINIEDAGFVLKDVVAWVYGCLSEDSEVLTKGGWVGYKEAKFAKEILVYDVENDLYKWEEPERWYEYQVESDVAFSIRSEETDQVVSRGHRCLIERGGELVFVTAEELSKEETFPYLTELPGETETYEKTYGETLATVTPIEYSGVFWCPTVSTGAFVARRNGKVFLTGNSGFPKSLNIEKALRKMGNVPEETIEKWKGFGSALKPAFEPITWAMKPPCPPPEDPNTKEPIFKYCAKAAKKDRNSGLSNYLIHKFPASAKTPDTDYLNNLTKDLGVRWVLDDKHERLMAICPKNNLPDLISTFKDSDDGMDNEANWEPLMNQHATVKPTELMRWLCKLVTPEGGTILDPFMGSGTTGKAALMEGFNFIGMEMEPSYLEIARLRVSNLTN